MPAKKERETLYPRVSGRQRAKMAERIFVYRDSERGPISSIET